MNTCGTCKFKGENIVAPDYDHFGPDKPTSYFICQQIKFNDKHRFEEKYEPGQGACVIDGSGDYGALCVEDEFGCNKWELA